MVAFFLPAERLVIRSGFAERLGFEPRVPVRVRRISSAVHSTTLASLPICGCKGTTFNLKFKIQNSKSLGLPYLKEEKRSSSHCNDGTNHLLHADFRAEHQSRRP